MNKKFSLQSAMPAADVVDAVAAADNIAAGAASVTGAVGVASAPTLSLRGLRGRVHENYPLAPYTAWGVGGVAQYFYQPADLDDLAAMLKQLPPDYPITWLGAATNVLIRDSGIAGMVIGVCGDSLNYLGTERATNGNKNIYAEAGVHCSSLVQYGARLGMSKVAFLAGIPGTVGGALAMNAGAYGDEIWRYVAAVTTINRRGELRQRPAADFQAGYREVTGLAVDEWFVAGEFCFIEKAMERLTQPIKDQQKDQQSAKVQDLEARVGQTKQRIRELLQKRQASQPLDTMNCGSVFRNPPGDYAARLIEACGLKGKNIGGARVSEKHANFIINDGSATAADLEALIHHVAAVVEQRYGIKLRMEVKILG
jgi:UDP-N-acetylmuramate dehydrogenase